MKKRTLHFVRHGATDASEASVYTGRSDVPLTAHGREQALALRPYLHRVQDALILSSPRKRSLVTAELALPERARNIEIVDRLSEIDFGDWEGLTFSEVAAEFPEAVERWMREPDGFRFPGGESVMEFRIRIAGIIDDLVTGSARCVLIFTHGGVIRTALCRLLELPDRAYLSFAVPTGSVTTIDLHGESGVLRGISPVPFD